MCDTLAISRSGYYQFLASKESARQHWRQELKSQIQQIHREHAGRYGSPRIAQELRDRGFYCDRKTVAKLMKEQQIRAVMHKAFVPQTTDSKHGFARAPNLLAQDFTAERPNTRWVADITYVPTREGWLYLAGVKDLCTRKMVGWKMDLHLSADLVCDAILDAIRKECPGPDLIHHSDQGVQYACEAYRELLDRHQITCSMSRVGNCYDNAAMESFWGSYKQELVYPEHFEKKTREEVKLATFRCIELYYNRVRKHSGLGYKSPEQYHQSLNSGQAA
jgi:transposase InsO family protein